MNYKQFTIRACRVLTIGSAALTALAGGFAMLPIDSANLPMPPEWRPYLAGSALVALGIRALVVPTLDAIIKAMNETPSPGTPPTHKP